MSKGKAYGFSVCIGLLLVVFACTQMAYADTRSAAVEAKKAAIEVAEIQNIYQMIDVVEQPDKLSANAEKMDTYLSEEYRTARVPWYRMFGTWTYAGILQDMDGYPCVMWVCRENVVDSSSVVYAFATARYVTDGNDGGYFTDVKFTSTAAGIAVLPEVASVEDAQADETQAIVDMIDEIREQTKDNESADASGMAAAAEERRQRRLNTEE